MRIEEFGNIIGKSPVITQDHKSAEARWFCEFPECHFKNTSSDQHAFGVVGVGASPVLALDDIISQIRNKVIVCTDSEGENTINTAVPGNLTSS